MNNLKGKIYLKVSGVANRELSVEIMQLVHSQIYGSSTQNEIWQIKQAILTQLVNQLGIN